MHCNECNTENSVEDYAFRDLKLGLRKTICRDCTNAKNKARYANKRDEILTARKPTRDANREAARKYERAWANKNRDKRITANKAYNHRKRSAFGWHGAADIQRLYAAQNGKCNMCCIELNGKYHVDHVMPLSKGGSNDPSNLQITCASCNLKKAAQVPEVCPPRAMHGLAERF